MTRPPPASPLSWVSFLPGRQPIFSVKSSSGPRHQSKKVGRAGRFTKARAISLECSWGEVLEVQGFRGRKGFGVSRASGSQTPSARFVMATTMLWL